MAPNLRKQPDALNVAVVTQPSLPAAPGNEALFLEIYNRVSPRAVGLGKLLLGESEGREVVADAFGELWVQWPNLTIEQRTDAYCMGAIDHHIKQRRRRNKRVVGLDEVEGELTRLAIHQIDSPSRTTTAADILDLAVAAMPPRRREVYQLVREFRFTYKEVAELLSMSEGTVNTHMRLASENLRAVCQQYGFNISGGARQSLLAAGAGAREAADV